jgi:BON domain
MANYGPRRGEQRYPRDEDRDRRELRSRYQESVRDLDDDYGRSGHGSVPQYGRGGYDDRREGYQGEDYYGGVHGRGSADRPGAGRGRERRPAGRGRGTGYDRSDRTELESFGYGDPLGAGIGMGAGRYSRGYAGRHEQEEGRNRGSFAYGEETDRGDYGGFGGYRRHGGGTGRGEHRGRGPRGYRRSDERIREDVNDRLTDDDRLDASDVEVSVSDCEVTLNGSVGDRPSKRRAEDLAESVSGVTHVQNNLRVNRSGTRDEPNPGEGV